MTCWFCVFSRENLSPVDAATPPVTAAISQPLDFSPVFTEDPSAWASLCSTPPPVIFLSPQLQCPPPAALVWVLALSETASPLTSQIQTSTTVPVCPVYFLHNRPCPCLLASAFNHSPSHLSLLPLPCTPNSTQTHQCRASTLQAIGQVWPTTCVYK